MNWIDINKQMPKDGQPVNIMKGLKEFKNYALVWDNDVNFHFSCIDSGHVIEGESITFWCYL